MGKLHQMKTTIFRQKDIARRDQILYQTLAGYFRPGSEFRKV
ncbi:MAG TPA: hypothetical protein VFL17_05255 [Anaerolineae bacterium]|nr:hypothetical protein [Anaerolineae bacterium]